MIYNHFGANPFGFQHTVRMHRPTSDYRQLAATACVILTVKCFVLRIALKNRIQQSEIHGLHQRCPP